MKLFESSLIWVFLIVLYSFSTVYDLLELEESLRILDNNFLEIAAHKIVSVLTASFLLTMLYGVTLRIMRPKKRINGLRPVKSIRNVHPSYKPNIDVLVKVAQGISSN